MSEAIYQYTLYNLFLYLKYIDGFIRWKECIVPSLLVDENLNDEHKVIESSEYVRYYLEANKIPYVNAKFVDVFLNSFNDKFILEIFVSIISYLFL